jgi:hypothetical protein
VSGLTWSMCVALVASTIASSAAPAQDAPHVFGNTDSTRAHCDSLLASRVVDSSRVVVRAVLSSVEGAPLHRPFPGLVLQEIFSQMQLPRPLRIPVFEPGPTRLQTLRVLRVDAAVPRRPVVNAVYRFTLHRDGTASRVQVFVPSLVPGLDSVITATITRIGTARLFPYALDEDAVDSASVQLRLTSERDGQGTAIDVFASMFPSLPVTDAELRDSLPSPEYPEAERLAKVTGQVLLKLVVDVNGEPVVETVEVLQATTRGFALSALTLVPRIRWSPAHVDRCAVPQLVYVPVRYALP